MISARRLRTWSPAALLLCAAACKHDPVVVAELAAEVAGSPSAPSAGTPGGGGTTAPPGPSAGGSGGTFEVAGSDTDADAGPGDAGPSAPDAASAPMDCRTQQYWTVKMIVDAGCVFEPRFLAAITPFVENPSVPVGEAPREPICDAVKRVFGLPWYLNEKGQVVLCDDACNAAREWLEKEEERVFRCMGLLDGGAAEP